MNQAFPEIVRANDRVIELIIEHGVYSALSSADLPDGTRHGVLFGHLRVGDAPEPGLAVARMRADPRFVEVAAAKVAARLFYVQGLESLLERADRIIAFLS